jgi:phosphoserine phosphatase
MFIATLISANGLAWGEIKAAAAALGGEAHWLDEPFAADIRFAHDAQAARAQLEEGFPHADVIVQQEAHRARKLLVADMDSTMITIECIDELADYAGIKPQIAEVTERAMRGELDFEAALRGRVALLKGLPERAIADCIRERVRLMGGARCLVQTLKAHGARAVLVSGGFTCFTDVVAEKIGFDFALANTLGITNGALDGQVHGAIVGAQTKRETLLAELSRLGLSADTALAVGDGANDIPMIEAAGLGIAYHAKPKTAAAADACIRHGDLTALLYACGYARSAWVND